MNLYNSNMMTILDKDVRKAVALYLHDEVTEAEAARLAGIPRAQLRYYARTSGIGASLSPADDSGSGTSQS